MILNRRTFAECLTVRRHTDLPFVMDETVNDVGSLLDCHREAAADVVNIKISKFGGLTKAKQERKLDKSHFEIQSGAATCSEGFVTGFVRVSQAVGLYCSCHSAQSSKGN